MNVSRATQRAPLVGILNVDKPLGWSSHDVVGLVRRLTRQRQVGHAGTLDPLATGVLLVTIGATTRLSDYLMAGRKCYAARLRLGVRTSTDDAEGPAVEVRPTGGVTRERVVAALSAFRGAIAQAPPAFAAIKKEGVPAYKLARQGKAPELAARAVRIDALALTRLDLAADTLDLLVWCSPGTYIRALARDVGEHLGCGAHLAALRRLSSGSFGVDTAVGVQELRRLTADGRLHERVWPPDEAVVAWPAIVVDERTAAAVLHGAAVAAPGARATGTSATDTRDPGDGVRLYAPDGRLLALARYDETAHNWRPYKVLVVAGATAAGQ